MAVIRISNLNVDEFGNSSNESSPVKELTSRELNATVGGWLVIIPIAWVAYSVGKEAKTNWFD